MFGFQVESLLTDILFLEYNHKILADVLNLKVSNLDIEKKTLCRDIFNIDFDQKISISLGLSLLTPRI